MSEQVQCVTCSRFRLKGSPLAKFGFGQCGKGKAHEFVSIAYPRRCDWHATAKQDDIDLRRKWLESKSTSSTAA